MSVKEQNSSLCQLNPFYKEKPDFWDETDEGSCFYYKNFDIS